jgi:hypothetical protein
VASSPAFFLSSRAFCLAAAASFSAFCLAASSAFFLFSASSFSFCSLSLKDCAKSYCFYSNSADYLALYSAASVAFFASYAIFSAWANLSF